MVMDRSQIDPGFRNDVPKGRCGIAIFAEQPFCRIQYPGLCFIHTNDLIIRMNKLSRKFTINGSFGRIYESPVIINSKFQIPSQESEIRIAAMTYIALTIAGSDPSGGAGIQADLKTFHQRGVYGTSVLTLVTVQNTQRVTSVEMMAPKLVADQLDAVSGGYTSGGCQDRSAGQSGNRGNAVWQRRGDFQFPLVVDPVMISKHGQPLMTEGARSAFAALLLPCAFLITPNLYEAGELAQHGRFRPRGHEGGGDPDRGQGSKGCSDQGWAPRDRRRRRALLGG